MLITSSFLVDISLFFITTVFALYIYTSKNYDYWKKKGVHYIKPMPFFGNLYDVVTFKTTMAHWQQNIYNSTDKPYIGIFVFDKPVLTIRSPEIIKQVLVKNFDHFTNRSVLAPNHDGVIANAMFFAKNENWKLIRSKVTPAFTSGKLKAMFPTVKGVANEMTQYIKQNQGQLKSKELTTKFSTEVIARTAFGINGHCFEDENCEFLNIGRLFFGFTWKRAFSQYAYFFMHGLGNFFHLDFVDGRAAKPLKRIFWQTIEEREKMKAKGNDLIDILIGLKSDKEFCNRMEFVGDKVVAQPMNFFGAGVGTTSHTIMFTLYELCLQPSLQQELREEILTHLKQDNEITYDSLKNMKLLEMCILETLRKYPAVPFLDRLCTADFTIPGTDVVIDKGTRVYIPLLGLNYDEKYFPEPDKYNPQRFADKSLYNQNGLYYMPFGDGPRVCIAERMGMMSTKLGLIYIISQFIVQRTSATQVPIKFTRRGFNLSPDGDLFMKFTALDSN